MSNPEPVAVTLMDGREYKFAPLRLTLGVVSLYDAITGDNSEARILALVDAVRLALSASYQTREVDVILHQIDLEDAAMVEAITGAMFLRFVGETNAVVGDPVPSVGDSPVGTP